MDAHLPASLASRRVRNVNVDELKEQRRALILRLISLQRRLRELKYVFRYDERLKCVSGSAFFELCKDHTDPDALSQAVKNLNKVVSHYRMLVGRAYSEARAKERLLASATEREALRQGRHQGPPSTLRAGAEDASLPHLPSQRTQQPKPWRDPSNLITDDRAPWADCPFGDLSRHPAIMYGKERFPKRYGPAAATAMEETCRNAVLQNWSRVVKRGDRERMENVDGLETAEWGTEESKKFPRKVRAAMSQ